MTESDVRAHLFYVGEDGTQFGIGVTHLGDIPVAIRHQLGKVQDHGEALIGESGGKLVGLHVKGGPEAIFQLIPSSTQDLWVELARMVNSFESVEEYNCIQHSFTDTMH